MRTISDPDAVSMRREKLFHPGVLAAVMISFASIIGGCTLGKPPTEALSKAELDLRAASEARADELAPMDLQGAREKLEASKKAMAAKRYDEARRLAEIAQVEAELAAAKAEAELTRRAAEDLRRRIDSLRAESERGSKPALSPTTAKE
jgi:hypothetical protein